VPISNIPDMSCTRSCSGTVLPPPIIPISFNTEWACYCQRNRASCFAMGRHGCGNSIRFRLSVHWWGSGCL
jgi:hypothetical protein